MSGDRRHVLPTDRPLTGRERIALRLERTLDRRLGPLGVWVFRRTKGGIAERWHVDALVLTTTGRRSGKPRTTVLRYFPDGDAMIVAAANDGGPRDPAWFHNLVACPEARVEIMGRTIPVRAVELPAGDADAWWERIVATSPEYDRFRRARSRAIPILRLTPTPAAAPPEARA